MRKIVVLFFCFFGLGTAQAMTPYVSAQSQAQLIFIASPVDPQVITVGLWIELKDQWHTYWQNPGHAGLAPQFELTITPDVQIGDVHYPVPERIETYPLTTFGYHKNVLLVRDLHLPKENVATSFSLHAKVKYLVCDQQCLIEKTEFQTQFSASALPKLNAQNENEIFAKKNWPQTLENKNVHVDFFSTTVKLSVTLTEDVQVVDFFPAQSVPVEFAKPDVQGNTLTLTKSDLTVHDPKLKGLIVVQKKTSQEKIGYWLEQAWLH